MPRLELGVGLRYLAIVAGTCVLIGIGFVSGKRFYENQQTEANVSVLYNDSNEARKIADETQERKNEFEEWLRTHDPYDKHGNPTPEFLQYLESEKSVAEQRGDQGGVIRKITKM